MNCFVVTAVSLPACVRASQCVVRVFACSRTYPAWPTYHRSNLFAWLFGIYRSFLTWQWEN